MVGGYELMRKKYKRVYSISLEPGYRNYTVRDLIENKGKKQLTQIHVATPEEAKAAEEAGIDLLLVRVCPELQEIRKAAPKTFITVSVPFIKYSSKEEIVKDSLEIIDMGFDSITCGSWNLDFMKYLNGFKFLFKDMLEFGASPSGKAPVFGVDFLDSIFPSFPR